MFDWRTIATFAVPAALSLSGMGAWGLAIHYGRWAERHRRTPLTADLLRPPGHGLQERANDLSDEILLCAIKLVLIPLFVYAMIVGETYWQAPRTLEWGQALLIPALLGWVSFLMWQTRKLWRERRFVYLGLDGERAVAEELNQLMLDGARVFHDVPIEYGNIDHVVITRSGVYAVETKMLGKLTTGENSAVATVDHQKEEIRFPDRRVSLKPFQNQMETQRRCLSEWLSVSTGEPVKVESILALPGWKIEQRIGRGPIFVINPKKPSAFFVRNFDTLSPQRIQAIAHQLEQRCRTVEPVAPKPAPMAAR